MKSLERPRSVRELALLSGTTQSRARAAVEDGPIDPYDLSWADVIALRAFVTSQSMVLAGEAVPRNSSRVTTARSRSAVNAVRAAIAGDALTADSVLAIGRRKAVVYTSLANASRRGAALNSDDAVLVLPIGIWWNEIRWRAEH
jgi:hypothetical protein